MNLWPVEDEGAGAICAGLEAVTVLLRERLVSGASPFGVGLWLPAATAATLAREPSERATLLAYLAAERLDAFTFNAFPFGDFHRAGLKEAVFLPDWAAEERATFTRNVARFGFEVARAAGWERSRHLSISTHTGAHRGNLDPGDLALTVFRERAARKMVATMSDLSSAAGAPRLVLGLEPEPRSLAGDTRELGALFDALDEAETEVGPAGDSSNIGVCLDACHAAVEFEDVDAAHRRALGLDRPRPRPLAKLQFSSALSLTDPGEDEAGFAALLALDEPVYLHQVTGRGPEGLRRAADLGELAADPAPWRALDELRCHFHVPVDLERRGGLRTTSSYAGELLSAILSAPESWGTAELHVEIETYTWTLGGVGPGLVDGIEAEYRHVMALLEQAGWSLVS